MKLNNSYKKWFLNGGREVRRKYNKEYSSRLEVKERARLKNARPDQKLKRKLYKQTLASKKANLKYRNKPEVKERVRKQRYKQRYGITFQDYTDLYNKQKGLCSICSVYFPLLHVDHCHKTKKIRGLLCGSCNRALGLMKDNTRFLLKAIQYLNHG